MMMWCVGEVIPNSPPGSVIWNVEEVFSHPQYRRDGCIRSPFFSALGAEWQLLIQSFVNFGCTTNRLALWKLSTRSSVVVRFEFGIQWRDGVKLFVSSGETEIRNDGTILGDAELPTYWRLFSEEFASDGVLSVFCHLREPGAPRRPSATPGNNTSIQRNKFIQVSQDCVEGPSKSSNSPGNETCAETKDFAQVSQDYVNEPSKSCSSPGAHKLGENLKELLSSEEASDVTLKVQNQEFKAHKAILVARSSVFRVMFRHEMSEKLSNEVHITDCDPDAFRIFLNYVYTGDAEGLSMSNAFNVFSVANKYDATELTIQRKDCIASNITVETVCDVVAFSLLHSDSVLLEKASEYFAEHFSQIILPNKWQCFFRENATVANELLIRASKFHTPPE